MKRRRYVIGILLCVTALLQAQDCLLYTSDAADD